MKKPTFIVVAALLCFSVLLGQNVTKPTASIVPLPTWEYAELVVTENGAYARWTSGKIVVTQESFSNLVEALKINGVIGKEVPADAGMGEIMDALGARHWELCSTDHPNPGFPIYHFKRARP